MGLHHGRAIEEIARGVAAGTVRAELTVMDVLVTRDAVARDVPEVERYVAGPAGRLTVRPDEGKAMFRVIELGAEVRRHPRLGAVAHGALLLELAVGISDLLLRRRRPSHEQRQRRRREDASRAHEPPLLTLSPWHASHLLGTGR